MRLTPAVYESEAGLGSKTVMQSEPPTVMVQYRSSRERQNSQPPHHATVEDSDPATSLIRRSDFVELPPGSIVGENYEIGAKLGAGAMGEVYAATHVRLGKRVAIKVIGEQLSEDPAAIERFAQEAKVLARLQHPAIVAVDHVGELSDGRAYFVMEFLRGDSLRTRMQRGRLHLVQAIHVLDQLARGLDAAHTEGVVHRDVKPENTYLHYLKAEDPVVKLLDFGLVRLAADVDRRAERTQSGVAIGTPMYMSPEQARGPDVDHRTDIYALGVVGYELILGQPPFAHARTVPELYAAHLHETPPLPRTIWPEIPPQLDLVLFAMLAKDPAHRPTLAQFRSVIASVRTASPAHRGPTDDVAPQSARTRIAIAGVALATTALIVGIAIGSRVVARSSGQDAFVQQPFTPPSIGSAELSSANSIITAAPTPTVETPSSDVSDAAVGAPSRVNAAGSAPHQVPSAEKTKRSRPKLEDASPSSGAVVAHDAALSSAHEDRGPTQTAASSPDREDAATAVEKPQPRQVPPPPPPRKPPGRDGTLNPFAKRGSAAQ